MSEATKDKVTALPIVVDAKTQQLVARDNSELIRLIQTFMKGAAFPKTLDTQEKIIAAWQVAASLGLPPMVAIQNLAVIHGSVCMWGQLPKALAERTGELQDFKQFFVDKEFKEISFENKNLNADIWAAVVHVTRKGRTMNEFFFSVDDAKRAGLLNKTGPWKDHTKVMLSRRAVGMAMKFVFPDALMGVAVAEYDLHEAPDLKNVGPVATRDAGNAASQLWSTVKGEVIDAETSTPEETLHPVD